MNPRLELWLLDSLNFNGNGQHPVRVAVIRLTLAVPWRGVSKEYVARAVAVGPINFGHGVVRQLEKLTLTCCSFDTTLTPAHLRLSPRWSQ